jgi:uncharacterized membrane protein SpoIIM required for sporulation
VSETPSDGTTPWVLERDRPLTASVAVFALGILLGGVVALTGVSLSPSTVEGPSPWFFFRRNTTVAVLLYAGGITIGVVTTVTLCFNGFVVGYAVVGSEQLFRSLALLLPHAVVELPAFVLAGAAGLQLPVELLAYLRGEQSALVRHVAAHHSAKRFGLAVLLLAIAAVLEAVVTPLIARGL